MRKLTRSGVVTAAAALAIIGGSTAGADNHGTELAEATWADVVTFADPETPVGESSLRRTETGVYATFTAGGVEPGHAVTLWWVVFNEPENCSDGACGEDDIFIDGDPTAGFNEDGIAAADIVVGYAGGTISSDDGEIRYFARLDVGTPGYDSLFGEGAVLKDAAAAEIHLITRSHGPVIAGLEDVQTTSFAGGCETDLLPPEVADAEGECSDLQFAVHQP